MERSRAEESFESVIGDGDGEGICFESERPEVSASIMVDKSMGSVHDKL